jgi:hypothetical protein
MVLPLLMSQVRNMQIRASIRRRLLVGPTSVVVVLVLLRGRHAWIVLRRTLGWTMGRRHVLRVLLLFMVWLARMSTPG